MEAHIKKASLSQKLRLHQCSGILFLAVHAARRLECAVWPLLGHSEGSRHWWRPSCMFLCRHVGVHCHFVFAVGCGDWGFLGGCMGVCSLMIWVALMGVGVF